MQNPRINVFTLLLLIAAPPAATAAGLNDTGQATCYNSTVADGVAASDPASIARDAGSHPRQDCRFGRDAAAASGQLPKTGAGATGFDFTKVCMNGALNCPGAASNAVTPLATEWACTRDNNTGLTWSLQTQSATWANATTILPSAANAANRCNSTGWRLPTRRELLAIVHNGAFNPSIDTAYFPGTASNFYWSNDTYAPPSPASAWIVSFSDGLTDAFSKANSNAVRLVRGGQ